MSIFQCGQINLIIKWWDGCAGHMLTYLGRTLEPSSSHHSAWVMKRQAQSDSLTVIISRPIMLLQKALSFICKL